MRVKISKEQKHRLNLVITERSKQRIERLSSITEAETSAEVIRNSLQLYENIIEQILSGNELLLRNRENGDIRVYDAFLNVTLPSQQGHITPNHPSAPIEKVPVVAQSLTS